VDIRDVYLGLSSCFK